MYCTMQYNGDSGTGIQSYTVYTVYTIYIDRYLSLLFGKTSILLPYILYRSDITRSNSEYGAVLSSHLNFYD